MAAASKRDLLALVLDEETAELWTGITEALVASISNRGPVRAELQTVPGDLLEQPDWGALVETLRHIGETWPNQEPLPRGDLDAFDSAVVSLLTTYLAEDS